MPAITPGGAPAIAPGGADGILVARGLALGSSRPALVTLDRALSFAELDAGADAVAARLKALGLGPGHRLALALPPGAALLEALLGALRRGVTVALLSTALGPAARAYRLGQLAPDLVLDDEAALFAPRRRVPAPGPERGLRGAVVLFTSGSSGLPKGVVFSPKALLWNAATNAAVLGLVPEDRALVLLDCAYCYALVHQIFSHLLVGASVALPRPEPSLCCAASDGDRCAATTLAVVPALLQALLGQPGLGRALRRLRLLTVGGAAAPEDLLQRASALLPGVDLRVTYGLTEAGPRVATRRHDPQGEARAGLGRVGAPLPGVELDIDTDGEVLVRSPSCCLGYLRDGALQPRPDGWLRTGDTGVLLPDGGLRITGRRKAFINRGGLKLAPAEIERALRGHGQVVGARVVPMPHPRLGEVPRAYVVPAPGRAPSPESLARHCLEQLGAAWVPAVIDLVHELPAGWKEAAP